MWPFHKNYPRENKAEVESLLNELTEIGKREDFLSEHPGGQFDSQCRNVRARAIGTRLHEIGDIPLMEEIEKKVGKKLGKADGKRLAEHLDFCWRGIGKF